MRAYKRLLKYVTVNTTSHEEVEKTPSGEGEFVLAHLLADEMKSLGMADVHVDEHAYVYGFLPTTSGCEGCRSVGFISHLDTVDDCGGTDTRPQLILNYDGKPISLGTSGRILDPDAFPHQKNAGGKLS